MRAAAKAIAGDLIGAVGAGELGGACGQSDGQRNVLGVFSLDERAVGRVALVLGPENTQGFRVLTRLLLTVSVFECLKPHHGSSVGSQQTRHTLHVKHIARSSPVDAGCPEGNRKKNKKDMPFFEKVTPVIVVELLCVRVVTVMPFNFSLMIMIRHFIAIETR